MSDDPAWMGDWRSEEKGIFMPLRVYAADGETIADVLGGSRRGAIAQLCAAAPALVRGLLLAEWCDDEYTNLCMGCPPEQQAWKPVHVSGCPVDAALSAAGFPDQTSRDAARERMRRG